MGRTTFSGPVRSMGGFYGQGPGNIVSLAAASLTLNPEDHGGRLLYVNYTAALCTITLPAVVATADAATAGPNAQLDTLNNLGVVYTIYVAATNTNTIKIRTTSSSPGDLFVGGLVIGKDGILTAGGTATFVPNGSSNDVIAMNGTTTGGIAGSLLTIRAVAANNYLVEGTLIGSGTLATPFADS